MQTLERLRLSAVRSLEEMRYRLDQYLDRIVATANHNALDREWVWTIETPANATYCVHVPNAARKVVGIGVVLQAGTCDVSVTQGAQTVSWEAAAGTTLNVTTTEQIDRASSANKFVADTAVKVAVANVAAAAGLCVALRTGS